MRKRTGRTKSVWAVASACIIAALITGCGQSDTEAAATEAAGTHIEEQNLVQMPENTDIMTNSQKNAPEGSAETQEVPAMIEIEGAETLLEGRFYRIPINGARIENAYFTMEVPEDLLDNTSCIVEIGTESGRSVLEKAYFFVDSIAIGYHLRSDMEGDADRIEIFDFVSGSGWLGGIFWADVTDYESEGILGDLVERSATTDISRMNHCYNELFAPVSRQVVAANAAGTGAYFLIEPSDVQYDMDDIMETEEYLYGESAFRESLSSFKPKAFPMEKDYQQLYEAGEVSAAPSSSAVLTAFLSLEKAYAESSGYAGEYAYDAYEAEYIITVDEVSDNDANSDTDGANDGGMTATISMRCSADIYGVTVVDVFEYTMTQDEEHEWHLTEDFVLPMERLTEPRFLFASSMPKDGIYVNLSKVTDLNKDGMPEVYIISAGGHEYHIFYYLNDSIQQTTDFFWTWTSDLFSTANGNVIAYAEPHTTGTAGILQYTVYEWGEEGYTLKEELWRMPVEWNDIDGQPTGYEYLASKEPIDPFDDEMDYSDLLITQEEFERRLTALGRMTSLFEGVEYESTIELWEESLIFDKIRMEILDWHQSDDIY